MKGARFIIRARSREQWETTVHKGGRHPSKHKRRVRRWSSWQTISEADTAYEAGLTLEATKKRDASRDVAVFYRGKRLTVEQLRAKANAERSGDAW